MADFNERYSEEKRKIEDIVRAKEEMDAALAKARAAKAEEKAAKAEEKAAKAEARADKAAARAPERAPCPKGTKRYAPVGPDCYTQEYIEAWQQARREAKSNKK